MSPKNDIAREDWEQAATRRRFLLLILIIVPTIFASNVVYTFLPAKGWQPLNIIITILFAVLFCWISVGFWSSVAGMMVILRRYDRFTVGMGDCAGAPVRHTARTALLFPVYNENAGKVMENIRTVFQSLRQRGLDRCFDVFILSDSGDPDIWVLEEEAWYNLCLEEGGFGKIFYRRRKRNAKRKSGNIADFCRRWGANYKYMVVFDADSFISGDTLARMVQAMESRPDVGILQTPPKTIFSRSLISRVQQFANQLYGPVFAAGLHYWQLGDAQYWGHNAIIRMQPFILHCQLPSLSGKSPLGGEILSHDFVESALMRRAGYGVWLAYDLGGSYEQSPPSLIDELARDRRWCQGNLQHSRLLFTRGFFPTHRALFINGIMSYGSALLWFFFLLASSIQAIAGFFVVPDYFPKGPSLFPDWPSYFPAWALTLLGGTAGLLFLPKLLALLLVAFKGQAKSFGGLTRMSFSAVGEVVVSTLLAPMRMLFHSFFVVSTLLGAKIGWNAQNRDDRGTPWSTAVRVHWWGTLLGLLWGLLMYNISPGFFLWLSPVVIGLVMSIPLSVWSSRVSLGNAAAYLGLFATPSERERPLELKQLQRNLRRPPSYCPFPRLQDKGFARAVVIPRVFALHSTLATHGRRNSPEKQARLALIIDKATKYGPGALNRKEKMDLLGDPVSLHLLHHRVWLLDEQHADLWGIP